MAKLKHTVFDKVASVTLGPEVARFLVVLPFLKRLDNRLDKQSPETWSSYGAAELGDAPCEFVRRLMDEKDFKTVAEQIERFSTGNAAEYAKDTWQVYNLLALQLKRLTELSTEMREQPDNLELRKQLVEQHEHLSTLASMAGVFNADVLGKEIRALASTHGNDLDAIYPELVKGKDISLGKKKASAAEFGAVMQIIDDANDFVGDLISEVEQKRINPNRFILKLMEQGISPAEFLQNLKESHPGKFDSGARLRGNDIGPFRQVILDELRQYKTTVGMVATNCALQGISVDANSFPTGNDDHSREGEGTLHFSGSMSWTERAQAAIAAARDRS